MPIPANRSPRLLVAAFAWAFVLAGCGGVALAEDPAATGLVPLADGAELYYQKAGTGDQVIIVPFHLFNFRWLEPLARDYTLIAYDMRNRGRSSSVAETSTLTIQQDVADLEAVRQHFGADRFTAVGWSYLGLMVALYTHEYPERVERIVQVGPVPIKVGTQYPAEYTATDTEALFGKENARLQQAMEQGEHVSDPKGFCLKVYSMWNRQMLGNPGDAAFRSLVEETTQSVCELENEWPLNFLEHLGHHFGSIQALDFTAQDVGRIAIPVLTIHGTRDRNAPYGGGREWAYALPEARLLTVEGAAHWVLAEHQDLVLDAIRTFMAGEWPGGAEVMAGPVGVPPTQ